MNKKRLYKQNGLLHPRGLKLTRKVEDLIEQIFREHERYHHRDLELVLLHAVFMMASMAAVRVRSKEKL